MKLNFFTLIYSITYLTFCYINITYTQIGKLFYLYIFIFFIIVPANIIIKNSYVRSVLYTLIVIFLFQPVYVYLDNYLKKNKLNTFPKNMNFSYHLSDGLIEGINGLQTISTDKNGFRSKTKNYDKKDYSKKIFFIGGSTTANIFLDDQYIFSNVVQDLSRNKFISINAGKDGHTSKQNLITFKYISEKFEPEYVVFLIGANDWVKAINRHFTPMMENEYVKAFFFQSQPLVKVYAKIYEIFFQKKTYSNATMFKKLQGKYKNKMKKSFYPEKVSKEFKSNLESITDLCNNISNLNCILMTQPAIYNQNLKNDNLEKLWFTPPFYKWALDMSSLIYIRDLYNEFLISKCKNKNVKCLDLSKKINQKSKLFYDDIHFNKEGNIFIGKLIYEYIKKN